MRKEGQKPNLRRCSCKPMNLRQGVKVRLRPEPRVIKEEAEQLDQCWPVSPVFRRSRRLPLVPQERRYPRSHLRQQAMGRRAGKRVGEKPGGAARTG